MCWLSWIMGASILGHCGLVMGLYRECLYIYIFVLFCSTSFSINLRRLLRREGGVLKSSCFIRQIYRTTSHGRSKDWQGQFATTLTQFRHNCFLTQSGNKSSSHFVAFFLYHKCESDIRAGSEFMAHGLHYFHHNEWHRKIAFLFSRWRKETLSSFPMSFFL
jgi:hypothetical protein